MLRVNAGLFGKAKAVASGGAPITGEFKGVVSNAAPKATIGPDRHDRHPAGRLTGSTSSRGS